MPRRAAKQTKTPYEEFLDHRPTGRDPEERTNQLTSLAYDLAEKQLRDGTASPSVITHFLTNTTRKAQLEVEKLRLEKELIEAKTRSLDDSRSSGQLYSKAIKAMGIYQGKDEDEESDDGDY